MDRGRWREGRLKNFTSARGGKNAYRERWLLEYRTRSATVAKRKRRGWRRLGVGEIRVSDGNKGGLKGV